MIIHCESNNFNKSRNNSNTFYFGQWHCLEVSYKYYQPLNPTMLSEPFLLWTHIDKTV